jgi:hypothetical protein
VRCATADDNEWVDAAGLQEHCTFTTIWVKLLDREHTVDIHLLSKPSFETINNTRKL